MRGELEEIFRDYKFKKQNAFDTQREVPSPLLDGEMEPDSTNIHSCPKCGSLNISVDMSTNKIVCLDCGNKPEKSTRINFQKQMEKVKEEEQQSIENAIKRGDVFLK